MGKGVALDKALRDEYERLFEGCQIRPERYGEVDGLVDALVANRPRYIEAVLGTTIPWCLVAVVHNMECSCDFTKHLHNGDPLTARTVRVPKGRPASGKPPFTWEYSARDALCCEGWNLVKGWTIGEVLFHLEAYNGWGYRLSHPNVKSPYLWAGTFYYTKGKYKADGLFSSTLVSKQIGCATLLRRMQERGVVKFESVGTSMDSTDVAQALNVPFVAYSMVSVPYGAALQRFLNRFPGVTIREDGVPATKTSDAFKAVFGVYLPGDPRG